MQSTVAEIFQNFAVKLEKFPLITGGRIRLITSFIVGQGALQLLQLLSGFLLIRWLSIEEYAQYSLSFAFQSTAQMLVELGFSGAVVALVGGNISDKKRIGNYIKAGKFYRNRFFFFIGGVCIFFFPLLTFQHNWPIYVTVLLLISILANLYFSGNVSYYNSPLLIHKRMDDLYGVQVKNSILRFAFIGFFHLAALLNAWLAAFATTFMTIANGFSFKKKAKAYVEEPENPSKEVRKEMLDYIKPIMPGIVFMAFQAQIIIFIISIFGETKNIAEVAALGRLGQIFLMLNVAGSALVAPYFARQPKKGLVKKFFAILSVAVILAVLIWIFSAGFPEVLIFLIGEKYSHLQPEIPLLVSASCLAFLSNLMWSIAASRKWLWWWMPALNIGGVLLIQILAVINMDLSTTHNVLVLSLIINAFAVIHKIIISIYGFSRT